MIQFSSFVQKSVAISIALQEWVNRQYLVIIKQPAAETIIIFLFLSVPGGELFERIVAEEYLMEDDAVDYVRQILEALHFMHERNFVHLDLKVRGTILIH